MTEAGALLWTPSGPFKQRTNMMAFMRWLDTKRGLQFEAYDDLWRWSVSDVATFWGAFADYAKVQFRTEPLGVLGRREMPGAEWFPGSSINFAEEVFRDRSPEGTALHAAAEGRDLKAVTWSALFEDVQRMALFLKGRGVGRGDRVAAYMPNIEQTVTSFLAAASLGAVWSSCSPDLGSASVVDRFTQIEPKVLIVCDGYLYGGRPFDRRAAVDEILRALGTVETIVHVPHLDPEAPAPRADAVSYTDALASIPEERLQDFAFDPTPFEHPIWVCYSSGTTGRPKAIVHGHGGIVLEMLKVHLLHNDMKPGDRSLFFTTTGWVMWNIAVSTLLVGGTPILYDGHPFQPDPTVLWDLAARAKVRLFGTSPSYIQQMMRLGVSPMAAHAFPSLQCVTLAGSPATPETMEWVYRHVKADLWVTSQSGGTDVASGFVGASPLDPVHAGEIQVRMLGVDVCSLDDAGRELHGEAGELVIRQPMPSMPLGFWGDTGDDRYCDAYFRTYPGLWRHGDFLEVTERGTCLIPGRSDATLNRHGVRIGTAEIYRVVERLAGVADSIVVNVELPDGRFFMPLFVQMRDGAAFDDVIADAITTALRSECSARHVPDAIFRTPEVPYTLTGKKIEVPLKRILSRTPVDKAVNTSALRNPEALEFYLRFSENWPYAYTARPKYRAKNR